MAVPLNQAQIQQIIDVALQAQAVQHQQALADAAAANALALQQANDANAAALQQAIAALPPAGGGPPPVPAAFALTPGLSNPLQPWNYGTSEGLKIFTFASSKLQDTPYNGDVKGLKMFLIALSKRGESYGWNTSLFTISNQEVGNLQDKNLLTQYGVLTLENCQAHATAYIGNPNRAAQASVMCLNAITASVGPDLMMKLVNRQADYTLTPAHVMDGTCMVYTLISCVVIHTRATISVIRAQLQSLPALMKQHKSNITNFNADVDDKITSLRAVDEGCQDLLSFLFAAYQTASDKEFREYIHDREVKWENNEIANMTVEDLMATAEGRYKVMVEKGVWAKPSREEADLMALAASIKQADKNKAGGVKADTPKADRTGPAAARANVGEWAWKNVAPFGNEPREKTFKNKVYVACKFHKNTQWVLKEGHANGCRNDPNFVPGVDEMEKKSKAEADKAPSKKALQFAHALMIAMEAEESGELEEQEE
jgi:hypothetical protein